MNNIILHIPKTGGTTLVMNLLKLDKPPRPSMYYRHITNNKTGDSNCAELFKNSNYYKDFNIIMFIRNPLERLESEFSFLRNRKEFIELWNNNFPNNFLKYIQNPKTYNSICKFLLGKKFYSFYEVTHDDYNYLLNKFITMNIIYCITEKYNDSLVLIENKLKINLNNEIINYRENLNKLKQNNHTQLIEEFNKNNIYDIKLYEYCLNKFYIQLNNIKLNNKFQFQKNKYHSLMLYTNKPFDRCPISIFNIDSKFVEKNEKQLKIINQLSRTLSNNNSINFCIEWIKIFQKHYKIDINININDPLETIKHISEMNEFK